MNALSVTDERRLIEAAQKDVSRFAELYELHFVPVYAYVSRRTGNREAAEDLTSEVFHHALANLPKYEWLMRIASNALADRWRRAARELGNESSEDLASPAPNPEEVEHRAQLFRLVDTLPNDQRDVIRMRFAAEKSIREIAQALGRTEGAVKQLQFRGIQTLRAEATKLAGKPGVANG